jgi:hypothetical protein
MSTDRIVIDQAKIRVSDVIAARMAPGAEFPPRSLAWWQRIVPIWITAIEDDDGRIVLAPNGHHAGGTVTELTPAVMRREVRYARDWLAGWNAGLIDLTDAIVSD